MTPVEVCQERTVTERARTICFISITFGPRTGSAYRVAMCETGGTLNPAAIGDADERGIFQIFPGFHADKWLDFWAMWDDPLRNAQMAWEISRGGTDWSQWSCQP